MTDTDLLATESFFDNAPCGLIVMAMDGTVLSCNRTFSDWLGYDKAALQQCGFDQLLTVSGRTFQLTHWGPLMNLQGSVSEVKVDLRHRDGHVLSMLLNGVRHESHEGIRFHLALFGTRERGRNERAVLEAMQRAEQMLDQKVRAEAALHRAQAELAKAYEDAQQRAVFAEQMVAVVSHDLKNPMTAIKMATELLEQEPHSDRAHRLLASVGSAAGRAQRMIGDLLDFASVRLGQGISIRRRQVDLLEAVEQCVSELRVVFANAPIRHYSRGRGSVRVDQDRVQQVIGNLVANSVAYGDLRLPITLTTDVSEEGATIGVHNHGPTIDQALIPTLFEPMTRGSEHHDSLRSVGLGLFIVKQIAEAHGGVVTMTSSAANGTAFIVRLPNATLRS